MKKIISIFIISLMLFTTNCTGRKSVIQKQIQNSEIENLQKTNENASVKSEVQENNTSSTDFKSSTDEKVSLNEGLSKQSISLKNNGKCDETTETRNVLIEDKHGNKMTIPVNNNSELNINSESQFRQENKELKSEIDSLHKSNSQLALKYDSIAKRNSTIENIQTLKNSIKGKETEKKGLQWYWWLLIGAVCIEFLRISFNIIVLRK
ncbi:MAG: hypothetical protein QM564_11940 [Bergeyella sp.]